jgi:Holliday junction resolvase-like predicted endonuclease
VRCGSDEIDLIALRGGSRFVVEVKTALRASGIDPAENLDERKAFALRRAAAQLHPPINRIDLITVVLDGAGADVRWTSSVA